MSKKKYPNPTAGKTIEIGFSAENREALARLVQARESKKAIEKEIELAEEALRAIIGDAEIATVGGVKAIKVAVIDRAEPDRAKMKADGIWEQYSYANEYNYLSI
jgi:hypothetical protein